MHVSIAPVPPEHTPGGSYALLVCVNGQSGYATDLSDALDLIKLMGTSQ